MLAPTPRTRRPSAPSDDIAALIELANEWHRKAERAKQEYMHFVLSAGQTLLRLKQKVGHGRWLRWLQDQRGKLEFSDRTARLYMDIAQHLPESELATVANLSLREAARMAVLNRSGQRPKPQQPHALPRLAIRLRPLVDAALQLAGADDHPRLYPRPRPSDASFAAQFDQAVRSVRRKLALR